MENILISKDMFEYALMVIVKTHSGSTYTLSRPGVDKAFVLKDTPESFANLIGKEVDEIGAGKQTCLGNTLVPQSEFFGIRIGTSVLVTSKVVKVAIK